MCYGLSLGFGRLVFFLVARSDRAGSNPAGATVLPVVASASDAKAVSVDGSSALSVTGRSLRRALRHGRRDALCGLVLEAELSAVFAS